MVKKGVTLLVAGALVAMGCGKAAPLQEATARPVVRNYAAMVYANYSEALAQAQTMKSAVDAFVADPTAARLDEAYIDSVKDAPDSGSSTTPGTSRR